jgi:hypothetical protein
LGRTRQVASAGDWGLIEEPRRLFPIPILRRNRGQEINSRQRFDLIDRNDRVGQGVVVVWRLLLVRQQKTDRISDLFPLPAPRSGAGLGVGPSSAAADGVAAVV